MRLTEKLNVTIFSVISSVFLNSCKKKKNIEQNLLEMNALAYFAEVLVT